MVGSEALHQDLGEVHLWESSWILGRRYIVFASQSPGFRVQDFHFKFQSRYESFSNGESGMNLLETLIPKEKNTFRDA